MRIKKTSQYMQGGASLSNEYGTSDSNGYTQEYINDLQTPVVSTISASGNTLYILKIGHIVILNGDFASNAQSGTITLPYKAKYRFGVNFTGWYPANGNPQAYGYGIVEANSTTLNYKASAAFTVASINAIYYTDD